MAAGKKRGAKSGPRPRSGFVTEEQRKTERLTLRLKPDVMDRLYSLSTELSSKPGTPLAYAEVVTRALEALDRELDEETEEGG